MKKIAVCLALFVAVGGLASAQSELASFRQEGKATWEAVSGGLWAAHPSLPIGSTPTVRNAATGREIQVTVVGQIPVSADRIVDVSTEVARAIGLETDGNVILYFPSGSSTQAGGVQSSQDGVNIVIYNHVIPQSSLPAWMDALSGGRVAPGQLPPSPVRVTPGIPDPRNGKTYRLQVGTWGNADSALGVFRRLTDANLNAIYEFVNGSYAVYAGNVPSPEVNSVVGALGRMGFMDIHVREQ